MKIFNYIKAVIFTLLVIPTASLNSEISTRHQIAISSGIVKMPIYRGDLFFSLDGEYNSCKMKFESAIRHIEDSDKKLNVHVSFIPKFNFSFLEFGFKPHKNLEEYLPYYEKEYMLNIFSEEWSFNLSTYVKSTFDFEYLENNCSLSLLTNLIKRHSKEMEMTVYDISLNIDNSGQLFNYDLENNFLFTLGKKEKFTNIKSILDLKTMFDLLDSFRIEDRIYTRDYFNFKFKQSLMIYRKDSGNYLSLLAKEALFYFRDSNSEIHKTSFSSAIGIEVNRELSTMGFVKCKFIIDFVHQMHTGENNIFFRLEKTLGLKF